MAKRGGFDSLSLGHSNDSIPSEFKIFIEIKPRNERTLANQTEIN